MCSTVLGGAARACSRQDRGQPAPASAPPDPPEETPMTGPTEAPAGPALYRHADATPDRAALILGPETASYRQLADRATRLANLLTERGLVPGDAVALLSEPSVRYHEVVWACRIGGFSYTTVSTQLGADE